MQQDPSIPAEPTNATQERPSEFRVGGTEQEGSGWRGIASTIAILIAAPVIALILTAFVFQSYQVDGPSMESTLQNTDRLIVWKVPRTIAKLTHHTYIPHRDDIIIFVKHGLYEPGSTTEKQLIKRVIGLPGDHIVVQNGKITLYTKENPSGYDPDAGHDFTQNIAVPTTGDIDLVVPAGEVFVCGDNRVNSLDSRAFGTISASDIVGKLTVRIFPISSFKSFI